MANSTSHRLKSRGLRLSKVAHTAIAINALQIFAVLALTVYSFISGELHITGWVARTIMLTAALMVIWGAALDIREARAARRTLRQREMLEEAYEQLETLNGTLRAQRHDFMNHIQVIYTLTELDDRQAALDYMDRVYGDIQKVSRVLKTASPAINALLAAKLADCEESGMEFITDIRTDWRGCPVPGWEMCRVLGNLIDNAIEAPDGAGPKRICVKLWEDVRSIHFSVENSGAPVPEEMREAIFREGYSTKGDGRGTGLHIVKNILASHGGDIALETEPGTTRFHGNIPRAAVVEN